MSLASCLSLHRQSRLERSGLRPQGLSHRHLRWGLGRRLFDYYAGHCSWSRRCGRCRQRSRSKHSRLRSSFRKSGTSGKAKSYPIGKSARAGKAGCVMKILLLNQFFWPDSSATSQLLTDLARGLVSRGHQVSVICADGSYAPSASDTPPAVRVQRVKALPFVRGRAGRMMSYLSFYCMALLRAFTLPKPDLVVSLTTPPLISLVGSFVKIFRGSRHFIWEMDIYPDVAIDLKYFKAGGLTDRVTGLLADRSRHNADGILALGECMKERLIHRGIPASKVFCCLKTGPTEPAIRPLFLGCKSHPARPALLGQSRPCPRSRYSHRSYRKPSQQY